MPTGAFRVRLTDLAGNPMRDRVDLRLTRLAGEPGTAGESAQVWVAAGDPDLTVTGVRCRGGIGTMYRVTAETPHHRPYAFLQRIQEDVTLPASDDVEFWVKPGDVRDILAPAFDHLSASQRRLLNAAEMIEQETEDRHLLTLAGRALYQALDPLRKACFLNLTAKAKHLATVGENHLPHVQGLLDRTSGPLLCLGDPRVAECASREPSVQVRTECLARSAAWFFADR